MKDERHPLFAEREAEIRLERKNMKRGEYMRTLLGSRELGPFPDVHPTRGSNGEIIAVTWDGCFI